MAGLLGSMYTGNSGLQAASKGVSVVGDNIANTNTVGFKSGPNSLSRDVARVSRWL